MAEQANQLSHDVESLSAAWLPYEEEPDRAIGRRPISHRKRMEVIGVDAIRHYIDG